MPPIMPAGPLGYLQYMNEAVNTDISSFSNYALLPGERFKNVSSAASKIIAEPTRIPGLLFGFADGGSATPSVSSFDASLTFEPEKRIKRQKGTLDIKASVDDLCTKISDSSSKGISVLEAITDLDKASKAGSNSSIPSEVELGDFILSDSDAHSVISERRKKKVLIESKPKVVSSRTSTESVKSNASKKKKKKKKEKED